MDCASSSRSVIASVTKPRYKALAGHLTLTYSPANGYLPVVVNHCLNPVYSVVSTLYQEQASATTIQLVIDTRTQVHYTLKRVAKNRLFCVEQQHSAHRELEIHSMLAHPNIVNLLSADQTAEEYLYLMEYLPLATYFVDKLETNNRPLMLRPDGDLGKLRSYSFDILTALRYLHSLGIVHMDIKPANLLATQEEVPDEYKRVKLCDFGLARLLEADGRVYLPLRCGTEAYMAPEIKSGGWITAAADMWSFGMFLHVLAFGYSPFAMNWSIKNPLPKFARHWRKYEGTEFYELLSQCLTVDPAQRISAEAALGHPFLKWC